MNPCTKNRRSVALMAAGALDAATAATLHKHLESCHGCRQYWESMCALSERLNSAELPEAELPQTFHMRLAGRIRHEKKTPSLLNWLAVMRRLCGSREFAMLIVGAGLAVAILVWAQNFRRAQTPAAVPVVVHSVSKPPAPRVMPPTLASYRRAANVSLENLDAVLAAQTVPKASAVETYTFSSLRGHSLAD